MRVKRSTCKRCGSAKYAKRYATYCGPVCAKEARRTWTQIRDSGRSGRGGRRPGRNRRVVRDRENLLAKAERAASVLAIPKREVLIIWGVDPGRVCT